MVNWNELPLLFRATALITGIFALLMSLISPVVYIGMASAVRGNVLFTVLVSRSAPILLVYLLAVMAAILLNPFRRTLAGAAILTMTSPIAGALMLNGLR